MKSAKSRQVFVKHVCAFSKAAVYLYNDGCLDKESDRGVAGHCCFGKQKTIDGKWEVGELDTTSLASC